MSICTQNGTTKEAKRECRISKNHLYKTKQGKRHSDSEPHLHMGHQGHASTHESIGTSQSRNAQSKHVRHPTHPLDDPHSGLPIPGGR